MRLRIRSRVKWAALALALSAAPFSVAQTKTGALAKAPVPAQIAAARKVFISYAGVDSVSLETFKWIGDDPDQAYDQFYAAMKSWGRYDLVSAPADADLVMEIRFVTPSYSNGKVATAEPQWGLTILDAKTRFTLWTMTEPVETANRKPTWAKNIQQGMTNLMEHLKDLTGDETNSGTKSGTK
jgi:hypothetical protein